MQQWRQLSQQTIVMDLAMTIRSKEGKTGIVTLEGGVKIRTTKNTQNSKAMQAIYIRKKYGNRRGTPISILEEKPTVLATKPQAPSQTKSKARTTLHGTEAAAAAVLVMTAGRLCTC